MSNKVIRICAIVIVVLLLVAVIAFISINVIRESKKANFYLIHEGTQITTQNSEELLLERGEPQRFDIAYFEGLEEEKQGYYVTVECIPNGNNFYFTIAGNDSSFYAMRSDVTEFFEIDTQEEYFTFTLGENFKATDVVEWVYSDKNVAFPNEVDCSKAFFKIVVHLKDGTVAYNIPFKCQYEAEGINISGNTGYFGGGFSEDCDFGS